MKDAFVPIRDAEGNITGIMDRATADYLASQPPSRRRSDQAGDSGRGGSFGSHPVPPQAHGWDASSSPHAHHICPRCRGQGRRRTSSPRISRPSRADFAIPIRLRPGPQPLSLASTPRWNSSQKATTSRA